MSARALELREAGKTCTRMPTRHDDGTVAVFLFSEGVEADCAFTSFGGSCTENLTIVVAVVRERLAARLC